MILRIQAVRVCGPQSLWLKFNDGTTRRVDVCALIEGPIFKPLADPEFFAGVTLDPLCGTVVWPNGADFAPEALYALKKEASPGAPVGAPGLTGRQEIDEARS